MNCELNVLQSRRINRARVLFRRDARLEKESDTWLRNIYFGTILRIVHNRSRKFDPGDINLYAAVHSRLENPVIIHRTVRRKRSNERRNVSKPEAVPLFGADNNTSVFTIAKRELERGPEKCFADQRNGSSPPPSRRARGPSYSVHPNHGNDETGRADLLFVPLARLIQRP